jgi:GAF domain-containing protein
MARDYGEAGWWIRAVCEGEDDAVALMATVACELFHAFGDFDWVGSIGSSRRGF